MTGEIVPRRRYAPARRSATRALERLAEDTEYERGVIRSISLLTDFSMSEAAYVRWRQRELEQTIPDAADDLAVIAKTGTMAIARRLHRYGSEMS